LRCVVKISFGAGVYYLTTTTQSRSHCCADHVTPPTCYEYSRIEGGATAERLPDLSIRIQLHLQLQRSWPAISIVTYAQHIVPVIANRMNLPPPINPNEAMDVGDFCDSSTPMNAEVEFDIHALSKAFEGAQVRR
jgi:hypothetical protein